jgi:hypothetical protein
LWAPWILLCGLVCGGCIGGKTTWPEGTIVGCSMLVTPFGQSVTMWAARDVDEMKVVIKLTVEPTCRMVIEGDSRLREN